MTVNEFAKEVHENAVAHGWWETARSFPEVAALIHSEVSEALEEWRDGNPAIYGCCGIPGAVCEFEGACDKDEKTGTCKPEGVAVELCDAIIRTPRLRPSTTSATKLLCASLSSTSARGLCRPCKALSRLFSCIEKKVYGNLRFPRAIIEA